MPQTSIAVISLKGSLDRRAQFERRAAETALSWRYFDALTDVALPLRYDDTMARRALGRPMTQGERGCYASHHAAWRAFLDSSADQLLVLEDDVIVDWTFLEKLAAFDCAGQGLHYLRLYAKRPIRARILKRHVVEPYRSLVEISGLAWGAQAYLLTRSGAEQLEKALRIMRRPIDTELDRPWGHGVKLLALMPFPVIEASMPSTLETARLDKRQDAKTAQPSRLMAAGDWLCGRLYRLEVLRPWARALARRLDGVESAP